MICAVDSLPFKGRVRVGMGLNNCRKMSSKPIPNPAFPLKGKEHSIARSHYS